MQVRGDTTSAYIRHGMLYYAREFDRILSEEGLAYCWLSPADPRPGRLPGCDLLLYRVDLSRSAHVIWLGNDLWERRKHTPNLLLLVFNEAASVDEPTLRSLLQLPLDGIFSGRCSPPEFQMYLQQVLRGEKVLCTPYVGILIRSIAGGVYQEQIALSAKEQLVLGYIAQGMSYKEMADVLSLSVDGVRYHVKNIYAKLNIRNKSDAVRYALTVSSSIRLSGG